MEVAKRLTVEEFERDGGIPPTFLFHNTPGGFTSAVQASWANNTEKHRVAWSIRQTLSRLGVKRYGVVIEMYLSAISVDPGVSAVEALNNAPRPSSDPNRREAVLVAVHDMSGGPSLSALYHVARPKDAKPRLLLDTTLRVDQFIDVTFAPVPKAKH
jgi:hypothetical protein